MYSVSIDKRFVAIEIGGVALEILIYYFSIGSINEYNIINSNGEIKALEEINKIPLQFVNGIKKMIFFWLF